jgi:6-phosphogluconolactonase
LAKDKELNMIRIFDDLEALSQAAAKMFMDLANHAAASQGRFSVALSGGHTPRRLYEILADDPYHNKIDWEDVHVFWGDERCVPPGDPRSNVQMAYQTLLNHVPIPANQIHPLHSGLPTAMAAVRYETELREFFGVQPPAFDLILLGLGENAHTASLFPHAPVLDEKERWVDEVYVPEQGIYRVTMTAPLINQAKEVIFLVSGADKALALQSVLEGAYHPHELPAQLIHPNGAHPIWLVDKAASHKLAVETMEVA